MPKGTIIQGPRRRGGGLGIIVPGGTESTVLDCPRCRGRGGSGAGATAVLCEVCQGAGKLERHVLERKVIARCTVPHGEGVVCGFPFYEGESQGTIEKHVIQCTSDHHDDIVAERERQHPSIMKPWDTEQFEWIRRNGEAILRGDLKV